MESVKLISDEIYDNLHEAILHGKWAVGEKIPSENQICSEYHASRISVRAAIHKLQAQGLIVTRPGKGSFVLKNCDEGVDLEGIDLSANDYLYMIQMRRALEFTGIELFCSDGTESDFERIEAAYRDMEAALSAKEYVDADFQFHYSIILGSHNPIFVRIYDLCRDILYKYFYEMSGDNRDDNWDNAKRNHKAILEAIKKRDSKAAISIIEGTFEFNYKRLAKYFKKD